MFTLYNIIIFTLGLIVGSFLNVVIYRLEKGGKIVNDRSKCLHCGHVLEWRDLIPIFSFIFLQRKCRYCGSKISWQYPLVELSAGILFVLISSFQLPVSSFQFLYLLFWIYLTSAFIVIFVYDLKHYIIPDEVVYPAIVVTIIFLLFNEFIIDNNFQFLISNFQSIFNSQFLNFLFAAILASGFFYAIIIITKGKGMGGGDVKLAFLMGLILGWPLVLLSVFSSFILGSIVGICLILVGKKKMGSVIPFGPFLIIGTFIGLFWGEMIIRWYSRLIN